MLSPTKTLGLCLALSLISTNSYSQAYNGWTAEVYPNPSKGTVNLRLEGAKEDLTHVNIVNSEGKSVFVDNVQNQELHTFDLTNLPKGVYSIRLFSTNVYKKIPLVID
jgi:hypothetical protein